MSDLERERREFAVGQVVWHEDYCRYLCIHSIVSDTAKGDGAIHSYIVPAWRTKGTIQVFADRMRPLTDQEVARAAREDELVTLLRQALCPHSHASGGNDYMACPECGLQWDYRKQTAAQAIRVCAWAEQARRAATSSQAKDEQ